MAVNFLRINILRSPMIYPVALWNAYTQILRHNCENKDNLEINFINKLHEKSLKRIKSNELIISRCNDNVKIDDDECFYDIDERKLMELLQNINGENFTYVKWISVRNECIDQICLKGSISFFMYFASYLNKVDPKFYDENYEFIKYLHQLTTWRENKGMNTELLIDNLCELYINHCKNDELLNKIKTIIQVLLEEILSRHGSSHVVNIKKSFERISEKTGNYEPLYMLWRGLFESFWFSDQEMSEELIASHLDIRKMLASRSKQLCFTYFQNNNTDLVNKLIQIFLKYKMRTNVVETLKLYLAFEIWRKNSSAATEIVQLFLELNIPLSDSENRKYLDLLLKRQPEKRQRGKVSEKIDVENYKFKF